jgi:hypothetical protein
VQRFKGLGEMNPLQLRETTMSPDTRRLVQLRLDPGDGTNEMLDMLLAKKRAGDRVYCTHATAELLEIMLYDAVGLYLRDLERENRRNARAGRPSRSRCTRKTTSTACSGPASAATTVSVSNSARVPCCVSTTLAIFSVRRSWNCS